MAASVYLQKKRKKRLEEGHPWIYANEIERVDGEPAPGSLVNVLAHNGQYLGTGYYNEASQIRVRVVSYSPLESMSKDFFVERFARCLELRQRFLGDASSCRLVYGEADFLPGLVVDRFAGVLVAQILTLGMDLCKEAITEALAQVFQPEGIYERSDVPVRELEGLAQRTGVLYGNCPGKVMIEENGLHIEVDIVQGQKNRLFLRPAG